MRLRSHLPAPIRRRAKQLRNAILGVDYQYKRLNTQATFDKIYREGVWGRDGLGNARSGSGSHNPEITGPYIEKVSAVLSSLDAPKAVDLGCGDFNVGSQLVSFCSHYVACDISQIILEQNRKRFLLANVEFRQVNIANDLLPSGDIAFVRQVLQHLSNADISGFVDRINKDRPFRYLIVTESLPTAGSFVVNLDKPSGPNTRFGLGSGVDLERPPFNLEYKDKAILLDVEERIPTGESVNIRTIMYRNV